MMGSFLTRGLVMVFGYAYPAYECFKTVEKNKPEIEQLRFWCQYWILVAMLTVFERVGDAFISWLPMYSEAKLAFYIYLWYPKTKGTTYIYDSFFRPYISKHETEIDRNLMELKTRAGDIAVLYWQRAASYGQTRVFEILQYVASQSTSRPQPSAQGAGGRQPPSTTQTRQQAAASTTQQPSQPPPSRNTTGLTQRGSGTRQAASAAQNGQEAAAVAQPQESQQPPSRSNSTGSTKQPPSRTNSAGSNQQPPYRSISTGANQQQQASSRSSSTGTTTQRQQASEQGEPPAAPAGPQKQTPLATEPTNQLAKSEVETMNIDPASSSATEGQTSVTEESVMEGTIRMTRGKLRTRAAANR